jgi:hypothetical protein
MSRSDVRYVRQISLEPDRGTGQVRFQALTWDKVERPDMSSYCFYNLIIRPDKSDWDLVAEKLEQRLCLLYKEHHDS